MMNRKRNFFSGRKSSRTPRTPRRIDTQIYGTHTPTSARPSNRRGSSQSRYAQNRTNRASKGVVSQVQPASSLSSGAARRASRSRGNLTERTVRRERMMRKAVIAAIALVAIVIAVIVGMITYSSSLSSQMSLNNQDATDALVQPGDTDTPAYLLLCGSLDDYESSQRSADIITLVRLDPSAKQLTMIQVPSNLVVSLSDGEDHPISEALSVGGDAELIKAVADFASVDIAHYAKTDAKRFEDIVNQLDGVTLTVPELVDDPTVSDVVIDPGEQTLSGTEALTFLRASNYTGGVETRGDNQLLFEKNLFYEILSRDSGSFGSLLNGLAADFKTDASSDQILSYADSLKDIDWNSIYCEQVPGSYSVGAQRTLFYQSDTNWSSMMAKVNNGENPSTKTVVNVDKASFTVTVKNGAGTAGAASTVSNILTTDGYKVTATGNTDSYVYDETLAVYKDEAKKQDAEALINTLGVGRAVSAGFYYTFDTDVMVVIGKDWKPVN